MAFNEIVDPSEIMPNPDERLNERIKDSVHYRPKTVADKVLSIESEVRDAENYDDFRNKLIDKLDQLELDALEEEYNDIQETLALVSRQQGEEIENLGKKSKGNAAKASIALALPLVNSVIDNSIAAYSARTRSSLKQSRIKKTVGQANFALTAVAAFAVNPLVGVGYLAGTAIQEGFNQSNINYQLDQERRASENAQQLLGNIRQNGNR